MSEKEAYVIPSTSTTRIGLALVAILTIIGAITAGSFLSSAIIDRLFPPDADPLAAIPISVMPGAPRNQPIAYILDADTSSFMTPQNAPDIERWADAAGNFYSQDFISSFSYEHGSDTPPAEGPWVRVGIQPAGDTFVGRIEAKGLKPNFAYQIKLQGDYDLDRNSFGIIGGLGRWRAPGKETNYTDQDFMDAPEKGLWESYLFFDWFVTDSKGDAAHEFALDQSLHVLWSAIRQRGDDLPTDHYHPLTIDASDPAIYARPKDEPITEMLWAERERIRYDSADQARITLNPWAYKANLVLTEESFHSNAVDGGWWATVYTLPVQFAVGPNASDQMQVLPQAPPAPAAPEGAPQDAPEGAPEGAPEAAPEAPTTENP